MSNLIDYAKAALRLDIKVPTLRSMVCRNEIPHIRISKRIVRFDPVDLDRWVAKRKARPHDQEGRAR